MNKSFVCLFLLCLCVAASAFAFGRKEKKQEALITREVEISGRVRLVGNSPMTSLVISGEERESGESRSWYIVPEEEAQLAELQQQMVIVKGQEFYYDRTFANGTSAGRQYYLKNIVVIESGQQGKFIGGE